MTHIDLEISDPCQPCLRCDRMCRGTKHGFLSAEQAGNVLNQAKTLGARATTIKGDTDIRVTSFTGDESLLNHWKNRGKKSITSFTRGESLNPEWQQIIHAADELGFCISFISSGSLIKESDADFLATVKNLKGVQLSLYALDEDIHDAITGVKGSCRGTKNAIRMLRERGVSTFISCPVMKWNRTAALDVMRWCDDQKINSCADIFIFRESDYTNRKLARRLSWDEIRDFFEETMKDGGGLSYVWGSGYGERDLDAVEFYSGAAHSLFVSSNGTIYPAIGWYYDPLGNIAADSIADVFENHPLLQNLRSFCKSVHMTRKDEIKKLHECVKKYMEQTQQS